jgi:hypothetical protein
MKIISFSLWGSENKYCIGAIKNAQLAKILYPGWICRYYCANSVPKETVAKLNNQKNVQIVKINGDGDWSHAANRFISFDDPEATHIITRDTDSRLSIREVSAVNEWIESGTKAHIMRDHPFHFTPVLAGMFGILGGVIKDTKSLLKKPHNYYHYDQDLLVKHVMPLIENSCTVHDEFFAKQRFPTQRNDFEFVGESFDEHDIPDAKNHRAIVLFSNKYNLSGV